MSDLCERLHILMRAGKRFDFNTGYSEIPLNGIYIMFERGEFAHNGDRIVRIGTHTGEQQLKSRIYQHFENENKNRSIFRKNIGRCFLNREKNTYLTTWNLDPTSRKNKQQYADLIDNNLELEMEERISQYIQSNLSFCLLEVFSKENRRYYESRLIGTVSGCSECYPSPDWFGQYSPIDKIRESGLWQVQELYKEPLSESELSFVDESLVRDTRN